MGVSRDCPIFSGTPYYLKNGESCGFQIWPVHSERPSQLNPNKIKILEKKTAWVCPEAAQFFLVPPIISGTDRATNFKFCTHIYRLNWNKSPL